MWAYLPAIRRVRRLAAANQGDGIFGSVMARNDPNTFIGKIEYVDWKLTGVQEMLVPVARADVPEIPMVWTAPHPKFAGILPNKEVWLVEWPEREFMSGGWETPDWQGAPWWAPQIKLARRPCWVIEGIPKDPYYPYGRWIIWMDKDLFWGYYKVIYNKAGEYWRHVINLDVLPRSSDGQHVWERMPAHVIVYDAREQKAASSDIVNKKRGMYVEHGLGVTPDHITQRTMTLLGK
jgi:hypothetical protein